MGDSGDEARKPRATVPMNRRARRYLKVLRAAATCPHVIEWGGHRVLSIKKGFAAAVKAAKLKGVVPHTLRHTAASWMAQSGVPMFEISKYLGHSDTRITERRYAHLSPDYLRSASKVLDW
jgi:integrase